jgi:cell division protein FtsZ
MDQNFESLCERAAIFVRQEKTRSCSALQRHLRIGYTLAMQIKNQLEMNGIYDGIEHYAEPKTVKLKAVGLGGAGINALAAMTSRGITHVETIAINAAENDIGKAPSNSAQTRIMIRGLAQCSLRDSAGMARAVDPYKPAIEEALRGAHMIFIAAGLGGRTGTTLTSILIEQARDAGALVVAIFYPPLVIEAKLHRELANFALTTILPTVDLVFLPLASEQIGDTDESVATLMARRDAILGEVVDLFAALFTNNSGFTPSFFDVKKLIRLQGKAALATGEAEGTDRVQLATAQACASLKRHGVDISAAKKLLILISMSGSSKLVRSGHIVDAIHPVMAKNVSTVTSIAIDDTLGPKIRITLMVAGLD